MRGALTLGIPLLCAVLQVTLASVVAVGEAHPDFLALVVVGWSVIAGAVQGMRWAFVGGMVADLLGSAAFGATTVSLLPISFGFGLRDRTAREPALAAGAALVAAGALAHYLAHAIVLVLAGASLPPAPALVAGAFGSSLYTGAFALLGYPVLRLLHRRTI